MTKSHTNQPNHSSIDYTPDAFDEVRDAIAAIGRGEFLIVSDDEDRENEGDLIIAAEHATPEAINFMITEGKGLVCVCVTPELARQKDLQPMAVNNTCHRSTAFTVSVDGTAAHGISTGISAAERAKTIELLISPDHGPEALSAPGHMFPLVARAGGVRERQGHTEAGVELARLAGCRPAAVIVEVIKANGEMARRPDLEKMAERFSLRYITIEALVAYVEYLESRRWASNAREHANLSAAV